jgi:hypothetical protein
VKDADFSRQGREKKADLAAKAAKNAKKFNSKRHGIARNIDASIYIIREQCAIALERARRMMDAGASAGPSRFGMF